MDPFTVAFVASQAFSFASSYFNGESKKEQAALNSQIAELNAMNAEHDAFESIRMGLGKKASYESKVNNLISTQNVAYAYADVDTSFGTAKAVQDETKLIGRLNAMDVTNSAYSQALGYKRQALNYRTGAQMNEARVAGQAKADLTASVIKIAAGTALASDKLDFGGGGAPSNDYGFDYYGSENADSGGGIMGIGKNTPDTGGVKLGF